MRGFVMSVVGKQRVKSQYQDGVCGLGSRRYEHETGPVKYVIQEAIEGDGSENQLLQVAAIRHVCRRIKCCSPTYFQRYDDGTSCGLSRGHDSCWRDLFGRAVNEPM